MKFNLSRNRTVYCKLFASLFLGLLFVFFIGNVQNSASAFADDGKNESGNNVEKSRKTEQKQDEYGRELSKAEDEYDRDISKQEDDAKAQATLQEKRADLDRKFDEKRQEISKWYKEKADEISRKKSGGISSY